MRGPKEKIERALGERLNLKAERSGTPKSAVIRKPFRPGAHGSARRRAPSDYGLQLKEKQKFKVVYGLKESQLRDVFSRALAARSVTRDKIFELLESRLDNFVYRSGLARSRAIARQLVIHGHIAVNGKKVTYPAFSVRPGNLVSPFSASRDKGQFSNLAEFLKKYESPVWILVDAAAAEAKMIALPHDIDIPFDSNLVVEYYSK